MSILDASAVLAYFLREPGSEVVEQAIASGAGMGVINLAEVMGRLVRDGISVDTARATLLELPVTFFDVDADLALDAGSMFGVTRSFGLSLGDRFCLALAIREQMTALTADKAWADVAPLVGAVVRLIR